MNSYPLIRILRHFSLTLLMVLSLISVSRATGSATMVAPNGTSVCLSYNYINLYIRTTGLVGHGPYQYDWYSAFSSPGTAVISGYQHDSIFNIVTDYQDSLYCIVTDSVGRTYRTQTLWVDAETAPYFTRTTDYFDTLYVGGSLNQNMPFYTDHSLVIHVLNPSGTNYGNFTTNGTSYINLQFSAVTLADAGVYQVVISNQSNICAGANGGQSNVHLAVIDTSHHCHYSVFDSIFPATCATSIDGAVYFSVVNASGTVQYRNGINGSWQTNSYFSNLAAGVDTFYIKDSTGCTTSAILTISNYNYHPTPSLTISANHTQLCGAGPVDTFSSVVNNGGSAPIYQWYKNGTAISGATSATYISTSLAAGDTIWLKVTSNLPCASPTVVFSNYIRLTTGSVIPSVTVSGVSHLCSGSVVDTFRASPINGGTAPTYQWYHGGALVSGATSATYISSTFAGYDSVYVVMTSSLTCASPSTATSAPFFIYVGTVIPSVSITASAIQLCGAIADTFRASPVNGGTAPAYQWYKNGTAITGATSATYLTTSLVVGDSVWVRLTSTAPCASPTTVLSNHIRLSQATITPSVTITATATSFCSGTVAADTFRATPTNGGTAPTYQWYKNGTAISGATASSYITTSFATSDSIWVVMTSTAPCVSPTTATSGKIHLIITSGIAITVGSNSPVASGATINLTASASGATSYSWTGPSGFTSTTQNPSRTGATVAMGGIYHVHAAVNSSSCGANGLVSVVVNQPLCNITLTDSVTAASCSIFANGSIKVFATGGTAPYQYKKGVNGSWQTSNIFSPLLPGVDTIYVKDTTCSAYIVATVGSQGPTITPTVSITASAIQLSCTNTTDTFRATQTNGGFSPSYQWYKSGIGISGATSATYIGSGFHNGDSISVNMASSNACASPSYASSNIIRLTVTGTPVVPSVTISATSTQLCTNIPTDTFRATPINGGTAPTYQWYHWNTLIPGATGSTYIATLSGSGWFSTDSITCIMTSTASCASPASVSSRAIYVTWGNATPGVIFTQSSSHLCNANSTDTFRATPTNGGTAPHYQWYKNNVAISGATSATYVGNGFANNDSITVLLTSTLPCAYPATAYWGTTVSVGAVAPSVTITGPVTTSCNYYLDTFYTHPINGGTAPTYVWYKNGVALAFSNPNNQLWNTPLANGDSIWVVMTSSLSCASPLTATSNHLRVTLTPVVPQVTMYSSDTTLCNLAPTDSVGFFSYIYANGGTAPTYQWYKNGVAISGANSANYHTLSSNLHAGDSVWVVITSNANCASPATVSTNHVVLNAGGSVPSVSITAVSNNLCAVQLHGDTIYATPINGGTAPTYQWYVNGNLVTGYSQGSSFYPSSLNAGDSVWVVMTSSSTCVSPTTATSAHLHLYATPVTASVTITASRTQVCGTMTDTLYVSSSTNGGSNPAYQWYKNGIAISGATTYYYVGSVSSGDSLWVVMTSSLRCTTPTSIASTHIHISGGTVIPSVTITGISQLCGAQVDTFRATPVNGGTAPTYQWYRNGSAISGATSSTYITTSLANGDSVWVVMTSSLSCASPLTAASTHIRISSLYTPSVAVTAYSTTLCSGTVDTFHAIPTSGGTAPTYQWYRNGSAISGATSPTYITTSLANGDSIWVVMTSSLSCASPATATSGRIRLTVNSAATATVTSNSPVSVGATISLTCATVSGATSYSWTGPSSFTSSVQNPTRAGATAAMGGIYSVHVTNSTSCGANGSVTVVVNSTSCNLSLRDSITPVGCQVNSGVVKVYVSGGTAPYQYRNGINGTWQAGSIFTGQYPGVDTIYVKDTAGCSSSILANITRPTNMGYPTATASSNSPVNIGGTLNLTAAFTGAVNVSNGSLLWTGPNGFSSYTQNPSISPATTAAAGVYHLLVYDDSTSCTARALTTVVINTTTCHITLRDSVIPAGCAYNSGVVTLYASGGTAPYKYKNGINGIWQSSNVFAGLTVGTDTFYVKDTITCSQSVVVQIIRTGAYPTTAPTSNTPVAPGGTINLLANAASATGYSWSGPNGYTATTQNPTLTPATVAMTGTYYLTVTNGSGCNAIGSTTVFVGSSNCNIALRDSVKNSSCFASRDGRVTIYPSGGSAPYQYRNGTSGTWQSSNVFSNLNIGSFTFYVKDTNNCSATISASITEPSYISNTLQINDASGTANNGSLLVFSRGGVGTTYTYHWSTGATSTTISGLAPGNYCVTATDQTGCTSSICDSIIRITTSTTAPLILYLDTVTSGSGQTATIHMRVRNFRHIATAQATIQFDPSVAAYSTVSQFAISSLSAANIGANSAGSGILSFSWFDPTLAGVTLTDGTVLFAITYNLVGTGGQYTPIVLTDSPTVREFDDTSLAPIPYYTYPGRINVTNNISISGRIHSWAVNSGVRSTTVALHGSPTSTMLTDTSGSYSFSVIQGSADTVTPAKNNDSLRTNGVSTLDVVTVQHYILGTTAITGPYALIAADVNSSGTITTSDYAQIQAMVLGNITTFTGSRLWTFVPSSYTFANVQVPWGFPTSRYYTAATTQTNQLAQDFVGVKLGDVTGDWNPALARTQSSTDSILLYTSDRTVSVHDTNILVPVRCRNCNALSGFQYSVQWDSSALSFAGISDVGYASGVAYGSSQSASGLLAVSWIAQTVSALYVPDDSILFYLRFSAIGARGDSSYVAINSAQIPVEMIDSTLSLLPTSVMSGKVKIAYATGITPVTADDMISIHPNPSTSRVIVEVSAPGSEILITDISGKEIYSTTTIGTNASISTQNWAAGIYTVSVRLADITKNIKLVVMH